MEGEIFEFPKNSSPYKRLQLIMHPFLLKSRINYQMNTISIMKQCFFIFISQYRVCHLHADNQGKLAIKQSTLFEAIPNH